MYDRRIALVQVFERVEQLVGPVHRRREVDGTAAVLEHLSEVAPVDELHYQELATLVGKEIEDLRQRAVLEVEEQDGFLLELAAEHLVARVDLRRLHGDVATAKVRVFGAIDFAHPAFGEHVDDHIAILEDRSWLEHTR